ncbi:MAG: hypothetical protein JNM17_27860 [Archangium sp.]|nr:hypothetical protein [Archangium sp.]
MDRQFLLEVEPDASFETVVAAVQGLQLAGAHRLQLVSIVDRPEVLWTKSAPHRHPCAVSFELSADGKPMSEFANWSQLLTAIDASPTPLKISAR